MPVLKDLTYTAAPTKPPATPQQYRRDKLVAQLREQLAMVRAKIAGTVHVVLVKRSKLASDGGKTYVNAEKRLKSWWIETDSGVLLQVKWGNKPVEFAKGKSAIMVANMEALPSVLEQLILAAANGEFDNLVASASKARKVSKSAA